MFSWIKQNKLSVLLIVVLGFFVWKSLGLTTSKNYSSVSSLGAPAMEKAGIGGDLALSDRMIVPPSVDYAPQANVSNRLVIQNSDLSLLVADVTQVKNSILDYVGKNGGYMVEANVANPQDAPTATVTIRIPSDKLNQALAYFHELSVKVVSENLQGHDVTDQYVDIEANIATLTKTKQKFEEILASAGEISDITNLNQQIISIQSQIDSYKGQQQALEKNAQLAKVTIYLSTDEIALPYAPSETFRPSIIFKLAVRSLVGALRQVATWGIWIAVYAVVWVPLLIVGWFLYKHLQKPQV